MNFEAMLGVAGQAIDKDLIAWRQNGVRGTPEERQKFHKEQFHGARGMMRLAVEMSLLIKPDLTRTQALEITRENFVSGAKCQATEAGFNQDETDYYISITEEAYRSLKGEYTGEIGTSYITT